MQALANTRDDNLPPRFNTFEHQPNGSGEGIAQRLTGATKTLDFDVEDLPRTRNLFGSGHSELSSQDLLYLVVLWSNVTQMVPTMSSALQPRLRSFIAFARPWRLGPIAVAPPRRCAIL